MQSSSEKKSDLKSLVFELQAEVGLTRNIGGLKSTEELVELCRIDESKYVLDVGCGVGITPCYLAKKYGCKVVGIDNFDKMIDWSNERAKRKGVVDKVEFRVADAEDLPFDDGLFDVVISEATLTFVEDKQKVVNECARVTKPGGYVGLSESIWSKTPPPELVEYMSRLAGANIPSADGWEELLKGAGLTDIVARTHEVTIRGESANRMKRLGCREFPTILFRALRLLLTRPAYRGLMKDAFSQPENLIEYIGYGIFVGQK